MRDPARIDRLLTLVRTIWEAYPDLRLCQLIGNATPTPSGDNYFVEDDKLEAALRQTAERIGAS